jgi:type IV secretory pathway protease TraF
MRVMSTASTSRRAARRRVLIAAAAGVAAASLAGAWLAFPVRVTSNSMAPYAARGDLGMAMHAREVRRGDVVVFRFPFGGTGLAIKRAVALAGDCVLASDGGPGLDRRDAACERVPPGSVFVLGDNAGSSIDSRTFGPVPSGEVVGRVVLLLPASRWLSRPKGRLAGPLFDEPEADQGGGAVQPYTQASHIPSLPGVFVTRF